MAIFHTAGEITEQGQTCVDCGLELLRPSEAARGDRWCEPTIVEDYPRELAGGRRLRAVKRAPSRAVSCATVRAPA